MMHMLGFTSEMDRSKAEQWSRLYQEVLRIPSANTGVGPGVRAVSELAATQGWPLEVEA